MTKQQAQDGLIERIRVAARAVGYAVAVHGSRERDLDLIAVPWVADARSIGELIDAIRDAGFVEYGVGKPGAHGRVGMAIHGIPGSAGVRYIDLSVMPRGMLQGEGSRLRHMEEGRDATGALHD